MLTVREFSFWVVAILAIAAVESVHTPRVPLWLKPYLPAFRFFAPKPLSWDFHFAYTKASSSRQEWITFGPGAFPFRAVFWNPERRFGKALVDEAKATLTAIEERANACDMLPAFLCWLDHNQAYVPGEYFVQVIAVQRRFPDVNTSCVAEILAMRIMTGTTRGAIDE